MHCEVFLLTVLYVCIPFTQASFKSSISGCMYTFIFFPGYLGPGTINDRNMCLRCIRTPGGRLSGTTNTGQQLYVFDTIPNGLNPSSPMAIRTCFSSSAFWWCIQSKLFHAWPQDACTIVGLPWSSLSGLFPYLCHVIVLVVSSVKKSRWTLGKIGRYRRTFAGTLLCFFTPSPRSLSTYLEALHLAQYLSSAYSFVNKRHPFGQACIYS